MPREIRKALFDTAFMRHEGERLLYDRHLSGAAPGEAGLSKWRNWAPRSEFYASRLSPWPEGREWQTKR